VVTGPGLLRFPQVLERSAKVAVRLGEVELDGESLRDEINGFVVRAHLMGNYAKHMQGDRLIGVGL